MESTRWDSNPPTGPSCVTWGKLPGTHYPPLKIELVITPPHELLETTELVHRKPVAQCRACCRSPSVVTGARGRRK